MEVIFGFIFWVVFCVLVGKFASSKGREAVLWGVLALFVSPLIAFVIIALLPDLAEQARLNREQTELRQVQQETERRRAEEAKHVHGADLILQLEKLRQLHERQLLTDIEYTARKSKAITDTCAGKLIEAPEDFLALLIPVIDKGTLTPDEITRLKTFALTNPTPVAAATTPRRTFAGGIREDAALRSCPKCDREIRADARICGYCWTSLA